MPQQYARKTHAEQADLVARIKAGDAARNELAEAVLPFARMKAGEYASRYGLQAEDIEQEGMLTLRGCIKAYKPETGYTFLNYFVNACTRRMVRYCKDESGRMPVAPPEALELSPAPGLGDGPAREALDAAIERLDPLARCVVRLAAGIDGGGMGHERAARTLFITPERFQVILAAAMRRLRADLDALA